MQTIFRKMSKIFIFFAICSLSLSVYAQKECKTIADVRNTENNTEIIYTGNATTTFYGPGGILIQDETGYIYVKSALINEWGSTGIEPNKTITNIYGVFKSATNEEMSQIDIEINSDVKEIKIVNEIDSFTITDVELDDLLANPMKYECQPIRLTNIDVKTDGYSYSIGNAENSIALVAGFGVQIPTRGTFEGYYGNNGANGFIIPSDDHVTATAYNLILDIKNAYEISSPNALEIMSPALVNFVQKNADNSIDLYIQQTDIYETTTGIVCHIESIETEINTGDSIKGLNGIYTALTVNEDNKVYGSTILISAEDAKSISVINNNNEITPQLIDDLEYVMGFAAKNYEALLTISPKCKIKKENDKYYLSSNNQKVRLEGIDFTNFENKDMAVIGILDAGIRNQGEVTIIVRSEKDIIATNYSFNSIAKMIEAGQPIATGVTYTLTNNVLATHTHSWEVGDLTVYGIFIQDETAGLFIESQSKVNITAGDSINGITGTFHAYEDASPYIYLRENSNLEIVSSNHLDKITPIEMSMAELASEPEKYASMVVKLSNVKHGSQTITQQGQTIEEKFLYQDKDTMIYEIWDYTLYDNNNIVGVFDYGSYRKFSIVPLSQAHITNADGNAIDNNMANNNVIIFTNEKEIVATNSKNITIYNINGTIVATTEGCNLNLNNMPQGVYIVVATYNDGSTKTDKIINK